MQFQSTYHYATILFLLTLCTYLLVWTYFQSLWHSYLKKARTKLRPTLASTDQVIATLPSNLSNLHHGHNLTPSIQDHPWKSWFPINLIWGHALCHSTIYHVFYMGQWVSKLHEAVRCISVPKARKKGHHKKWHKTHDEMYYGPHE